MGHWKDLSQEIIVRIAQILNEGASEHDWVYVNKRLYTYKKSIDYKEIQIDSTDTSSKILSTIFDSPFHPGKWVKGIRFKRFTAPDNLDSINPDMDILYQLIRHCPNVKEVHFPVDPVDKEDRSTNSMVAIGVKEWDYFARVLVDNDIWELGKLPDPPNKKRQLLPYYKCAFHMRDSLTKLYLTQEMAGIDDFKRLSEFNQLTDLDVSKNILKNLYDSDNMLEHLPHLARLYVEGFQTGKDDMVDIEGTEQKTNKMALFYDHSNIKNLKFSHYSTWREKELLYLMKTYANLEYLDIRGALASKTTTISATVMKSFIEFTLKMQKSYINFDGLSNLDWLVDMYRDHPQNYYQKQCKLQLSINLLENDQILPSNSKFNVNFVQNSNPAEACIKITYGMNDEPSARKLALKNSLLHIHRDVEKVSINLSNHLIQGGEYIDVLLGEIHANLNSLEVIGGLLYKYSSAQNRFCRGQHITDLKFKQIHIAERILPHLSKEFPYLENLAFDSCDFGTTRNHIDISMTSTDIGTLCIQGKDISGSTILLKIYSADQRSIKFYFDITMDEMIEEISQKKYDALLEALKPSALTIISIYLKSITQFTFKASIKGDWREINLSYP